MHTLIVVDMQSYFGVSSSMNFTRNIEREITKTIDNGGHIIFVEFSSYGDTLLELTKLVTEIGYKWAYTVIKGQDDGSVEVANSMFENNVPYDHLRVVGVNTDCCVLETVKGLTRQFPDSKIEVVEDACNSLWSQGFHLDLGASKHFKGLRSLAKLPGVKVIKS